MPPATEARSQNQEADSPKWQKQPCPSGECKGCNFEEDKKEEKGQEEKQPKKQLKRMKKARRKKKKLRKRLKKRGGKAKLNQKGKILPNRGYI